MKKKLEEPKNVGKTRQREVTITKEVIQVPEIQPPDHPPERPERRDVWELCGSTTEQDWKERNLVAYLHRINPTKTKGLGPYLRKYYAPFDIDQIKEEWGGSDFPNGVEGCYTVLMNERNHIWFTQEFQIAGPARYPNQSQVSSGEGDSDLLHFLRDQSSKVDRLQESIITLKTAAMSSQAENPAISMLAGAFTTGLTKLAEVQATGPRTDPIYDQLIKAAIAKMLNPPDPYEGLAKLGTVLGEKLKDILPDLSLGGNGEPPNIWIALLKQAPELLDRIVNGLREYGNLTSQQARALEAQARLQNPAAFAADLQPPTGYPQPVNGAAIADVDAAAQGAGLESGIRNPDRTVPTEVLAPGEPSQDWIKARIVDQIVGGREGDEIGDFLLVTDPRVVKTLASLSEQEMLSVFQTDPILSRAARSGRISDVVREFRTWAEDLAASDTEPGVEQTEDLPANPQTVTQ
jgi:hypothetical protein